MAAGADATAAGAKVAGKAAVVTAVTTAILAVLARLRRRRAAAVREWMLRAGATEDDVAAALADEDRREVVYRRLAEQRVRAGVNLASLTEDPSVRAAAIQSVIQREQRFASQRAAASAERVLASAERKEMRETSPLGAFWRLGYARMHTPDCVAMAGQFWPWSVLNKVRPLLHTGCKCSLVSYGKALAEGLMTAADVRPEAEALALAAPVIQHVEEERAGAEAKYGGLAEADEVAALEEMETRLALVGAGLMLAEAAAAVPLATDPSPAPLSLLEAEAVEQTGAMVALFPEPKVAKKLALPGGDPPEQLHVTLAFLGEAEDLDFDAAKAVVEGWAKSTPVMEGSLSGIGHFDIGKGQYVTYRSLDLPGLPAPREKLVDALDGAGVPPKRDHGFTPHMTLLTGPKMKRPKVKAEPISFSAVTLAWGGERTSFELTGTAEVPSAPSA